MLKIHSIIRELSFRTQKPVLSSTPYCPKQLSLGPLEEEILNIIWDLGSPTAREIHERILSDPDRELTIVSVMTVLRRLTDKGWLLRRKHQRYYHWHPRLSRAQGKAVRSRDRLQKFLDISSPDIVAAFADHLDQTSLEKLDHITQRLKAARQAREER
jgi:predicted transcriptional regulator